MVADDKIRPLSNYMKEILMEIHERELMKLEPAEAGSIKHVKGLIQRGLLGTRAHTTEKGKKIVVTYITKAGSDCLAGIG